MVEYHAYAKINLALSILGKREDGYHEIATLMVPVDIADLVSVEAITQGLRVYCPQLPGLAQEDNLAYKVAALLLSGKNLDAGFAISLQKAIPAGMGLGGGSSDAAATLLALRDLLVPRHKPNFGHLIDIASQIGSDIPFFIGANSKPPLWQAALCTGRGEKIRQIEGGSYWMLLILPEVRVSAAKAYAGWDAMNFYRRVSFSGLASDRAMALDPRLCNVIEALPSNNPRQLGTCIFNDFEASLYSSHPELSIIKENLLLSGAYGAALTGSGSAVYGICGSREHALKVKARFLKMSRKLPIIQAVVTRTGV